MGVKTYDLIEEAFDVLPMGCLIERRVLCVHGGIGQGDWDLNDMRSVKRPMTESELAMPKNRWLYNILWSDPIEDDAEDSDSDNEGHSQVFGVHESPRMNKVVLFGWDVTKTFCARNGLDLVVRSHQCKQGGLGFDIMHEQQLVRVFSARDYEGHGNDSAILRIDWIQPPGPVGMLSLAGLPEPSTGEDAINPPTPNTGHSTPVARPERLLIRPQVLHSLTKSQEASGIKRRTSVTDVSMDKNPVVMKRQTSDDKGPATLKRQTSGDKSPMGSAGRGQGERNPAARR